MPGSPDSNSASGSRVLQIWLKVKPYSLFQSGIIKIFTCFYCVGPPAARVANLGGNWNNGSQAGVFYANVNNGSSNRNRNIGGRLFPV